MTLEHCAPTIRSGRCAGALDEEAPMSVGHGLSESVCRSCRNLIKIPCHSLDSSSAFAAVRHDVARVRMDFFRLARLCLTFYVGMYWPSVIKAVQKRNFSQAADRPSYNLPQPPRVGPYRSKHLRGRGRQRPVAGPGVPQCWHLPMHSRADPMIEIPLDDCRCSLPQRDCSQSTH